MRHLRQPTGRPPLSRRERAVLGLPSLVLGVVPLVAPRWTVRVLGLPAGPPAPLVVRLVGARELVVAVAFLRSRSPHLLWGFVAQDALDLPVLVGLLTGANGRPRRLRGTAAAYLAMAVVDVTSALRQDVPGR